MNLMSLPRGRVRAQGCKQQKKKLAEKLIHDIVKMTSFAAVFE
jgi:hypothetical protein